ncbi:hypothetical protein DFH06DRAFT_127987 [Mycena polygramma]|nr:hypothetical protein DFH06DRAFT_127987 [Mycena polygramma]
MRILPGFGNLDVALPPRSNAPPAHMQPIIPAATRRCRSQAGACRGAVSCSTPCTHPKTHNHHSRSPNPLPPPSATSPALLQCMRDRHGPPSHRIYSRPCRRSSIALLHATRASPISYATSLGEPPDHVRADRRRRQANTDREGRAACIVCPPFQTPSRICFAPYAVHGHAERCRACDDLHATLTRARGCRADAACPPHPHRASQRGDVHADVSTHALLDASADAVSVVCVARARKQCMTLIFPLHRRPALSRASPPPSVLQTLRPCDSSRALRCTGFLSPTKSIWLLSALILMPPPVPRPGPGPRPPMARQRPYSDRALHRHSLFLHAARARACASSGSFVRGICRKVSAI